ncbi:hypothetical protein EVAR_83888_1 [Eumeta japonica]|uniref:Uncharacterized protein n=1 Tax=Eumeta variegata TaxID=151549 RepID=A0A4C1URB3_EUMVA|nr:hypothetical protein EVAR_83888_1 [Eumeta japonica]
MSNLSRKDRGSSDSGSETRDDGDTEIDADIAKRFLRTCEILNDPKSNREVVLEKFPNWGKAEFSEAGSNWFRLGNQRAGE